MIYVDEPRHPHRGSFWCHMMTDGDVEELHAFATRLGLKRKWFQGDHYDLSSSKRSLAMELGARAVNGAFLVTLRREQRERSKA